MNAGTQRHCLTADEHGAIVHCTVQSRVGRDLRHRALVAGKLGDKPAPDCGKSLPQHRACSLRNPESIAVRRRGSRLRQIDCHPVKEGRIWDVAISAALANADQVSGRDGPCLGQARDPNGRKRSGIQPQAGADTDGFGPAGTEAVAPQQRTGRGKDRGLHAGEQIADGGGRCGSRLADGNQIGRTNRCCLGQLGDCGHRVRLL